MRDEVTAKGSIKKRLILLLTAAACLVMIFSSAGKAHDPLVIIVNAENPVQKLTLREIRILYENGLIPWSNGTRVTFYDLYVIDGERRKFSQAVLKQEALGVHRYWIRKKLTNTAINPPKTLRSARLVQQRVARNFGAIGYVYKGDLTVPGVKVVATIE
jgi:ABC-type phosphate transport system substrate-binding protein